MSKISLSPNVAGTATFEIAAPNSNTNRTLTLPDSTGTLLNDQSNLEAQTKTALSATGSAPVFGCRAWVNFDGTRNAAGTVDSSNTNRLIKGSGNVASVLKTGAGSYTVNFSQQMPSANYAVSATGFWNTGPYTATTADSTAKATTNVRIVTGLTGTGAGADIADVTVAVFG